MAIAVAMLCTLLLSALHSLITSSSLVTSDDPEVPKCAGLSPMWGNTLGFSPLGIKHASEIHNRYITTVTLLIVTILVSWKV